MGATVYAPPSEIEAPDFMPYQDYGQRCAEYQDKIREYCEANGKGKFRGQVASFGVADGSARYYVLSLSPLVLILDQSGDAWQYQYINRLTAGDIKARCNDEKKLAKLFGKSK